MQPAAQAWQVFDETGRLTDETVAGLLRALGSEVVRAARQFRAEGTCDFADGRQFSPKFSPTAAGEPAWHLLAVGIARNYQI